MTVRELLVGRGAARVAAALAITTALGILSSLATATGGWNLALLGLQAVFVGFATSALRTTP